MPVGYMRLVGQLLYSVLLTSEFFSLSPAVIWLLLWLGWGSCLLIVLRIRDTGYLLLLCCRCLVSIERLQCGERIELLHIFHNVSVSVGCS